mmetsp:Transcript_26545/g.61992  ORF Transcript_26545/g.61992 Transcript_26545/m.61992 type:complete len:203 (-) Transcript_26545:2758-3366(-)
MPPTSALHLDFWTPAASAPMWLANPRKGCELQEQDGLAVSCTGQCTACMSPRPGHPAPFCSRMLRRRTPDTAKAWSNRCQCSLLRKHMHHSCRIRGWSSCWHRWEHCPLTRLSQRHPTPQGCYSPAPRSRHCTYRDRSCTNRCQSNPAGTCALSHTMPVARNLHLPSRSRIHIGLDCWPVRNCTVHGHCSPVGTVGPDIGGP